MAKSDTSLENLSLRRAYSPPNTAKWAGDTSVNGFDTETADGDVFQLSVSWEGFGGMVVDNDKRILKPGQVWRYLTHSRARGALNMWYNLDFDANVILKNILSKDEMARLSVEKSVETADGYTLTYIPGKFLKIEDDSKHVWTHYDASQFFYTSLQNAAEEWLGKTKLDEGVDVTKFGKKDETTVNDYIRERWQKISEYAREDAVLVKELWQEAIDVGEGLGIPMGRPFSTGYLSESYLNEHMAEKPGLGPRPMSKLAWDSYAGGRFEILKRGKIGRVAGPDINSAYPHILQNLPDPKTLTWERKQSPSLETLESADYGFVKATVTTDSDRAIQPFAVKVDDKLQYPALDGYTITVVKDLFVHAINQDIITDYGVIDSWLGYENETTVYPFDFIQDLYQTRKAFESGGEMKKGLLLKIILNSMYGKTCQTTPKRKRVEDGHELEDEEEYLSSMQLPKALKKTYENGFVEWLEAGAWFNPFIASYITGLTRLELHKRVLEYGLEDNVVMMATDCLMIEEDAFDKTNFAEDLVKDGLGNWDYDYSGDAFVIGAGIYEIKKDDGSLKTQTRGFREAQLSDGLLAEASRANGHIDISSHRPRTMAEIVWQNEQASNIGVFMDMNRVLRADMDTKREWENTATFKSLLGGVENSRPKLLSG